MNPGPDEPENGGGSSNVPTNSERLRYIADLITELKQMAEKAGYKTLANILGMAQVEARLQRRELER